MIKDAEHDSLALTSIELELSNLGQMTILREWQHIDILLLDESNRLAIVIENKIGTDEHSDQLQRYYQTVCQRYPDYRIVGLYLTPSGEEPSHEAYLPVSYGLVCEVLGDLVESRASVLNVDLQTLVTHYTQMLRRHIVGDSEIAKLCREIYRKHQRALDLIFEHRPDVQTQVKDILEAFIENEPGLELDDISKTRIRFAVQEWDKPVLLTAEDWTRSKRILMFEFWNSPNSLQLKLMLGPGSAEVRQKIFNMAHTNTGVFRTPNLGAKHSAVHSHRFLEQGMYENASREERESEIRKRWAEFLERDLPRIDAVLKKERWIWDRPDEAEETIR